MSSVAANRAAVPLPGGGAGSDSRLARNSAFMMATTIVNSGFGYVYWIIAAHVFAPSAVGLGNALISALMIASIVSNLGVPLALVERLPRLRDDLAWSRTLMTGMLVAVLGGVIAGAIVVAGLPLVSSRFALLSDPRYAALFMVGVPVWTATTVLDYAFVAERQAGKMLWRNGILGAVKLVVLVVPVMIVPATPLWLLGSLVFGAVLSLLSGIWLLRRVGRRITLRPDGLLGELRATWCQLIGHHVTTIGGLLPMYVLPVLVTIEISAADNAYFALTWMVGNIFLLASPAIASSLLAEGSHSPADAERQAFRALGICGALLVLPITVSILAAAPILHMFGPGYASHAATLFRLLALSAIPDAITNIWVSHGRGTGRLRETAALNLGMALGAVLASWLLMPSLGISGAGWAWLGAQCAGTVWVAFAVVRDRIGLPARVRITLSLPAPSTLSPLDTLITTPPEVA